MWRICHLRADSVVWLSHTSSIWPWSGAPKNTMYNTFLGSLHQSTTNYKDHAKSTMYNTFLGGSHQSTMNYKHLCLNFGITPTVCSHSINWMLKKVVRLLRGHPFARVNFPNREMMREYANMVQMRESMVDDIIGFMDGVSFPAECTDDRVKQNAMYCGYDCDTMVNSVFAYGPDGKVFFLQLTFPEVVQMEVWRHISCIIWKVRLATIIYASTRDFPKAVRHMVRLLGQSQRGQHNIFTVTCTITSSAFLIYTRLFGKQVSGVCADCKVRSPAAKNACQVTPNFAVWSSRGSFLCIISEPIMSVTVKFRQYSCRSTFGSKTFKVTTESLSITSIQGTTTARLMGMGVAVMAKATRITVYCMTN